MTSPSALRRIEKLLWLQIGAGALFAVLGAWFPVYTFMEYGLSVHPVYDRDGNILGSASYFLVGLGIGLFTIALAACAIFMGRRSLRALKTRPGSNE